jgi:hypothetical protein
LPKDSKQAMIMKEEFLEFYQDYVIALIIYYVASIWVMFVPCNSLYSSTFATLMRTIARFANIFKVLLPMTLFVIRTKDPLIHSEVSDGFNHLGQCICSCFGKTQEDIIDPTDKNTGYARSKTSESFDSKDKRLMQINENSNGVMWFNVIGIRLRHAIIRTILNFIGTLYCKSISDETGFEEELASWRITGSEKYELYEISSEKFMKDYGMKTDIYDCQVSVYYAAKFKEQFDLTNRSPKELLKAFSLANCAKILQKIQDQDSKEESDGEGGASGELFVISLNKKFILKTISYEEGKIFSTMIEDKRFFEHFLVDNPGSIMPRIFGYFEFSFTKLNAKKQYVIIMENLSPVPSDCVIRKFDLKGSTVGREVLKKKAEQGLSVTPDDTQVIPNLTDMTENTMNAELKKFPGTLKDIDFQKLEHLGISVKPEDRVRFDLPAPGPLPKSGICGGEEISSQNLKRD